MTTAQAKLHFKKFLVNPCPSCGAAVGELCHSGGAWVHIERFELIWYPFVALCGQRFETEELRQTHRFDGCALCDSIVPPA